MEHAECLVIVQRHQRSLFAALCRRYAGAAEVLFDRGVGERRRGGRPEGVDRRVADRRRLLEPAERAAWTELRHLRAFRAGARAGAAADLSV